VSGQQQPVVETRGESPPGNVPKNRQTWIMAAIAVVIVCAVVFSGTTEPPAEEHISDACGRHSPFEGGD